MSCGLRLDSPPGFVRGLYAVRGGLKGEMIQSSWDRMNGSCTACVVKREPSMHQSSRAMFTDVLLVCIPC